MRRRTFLRSSGALGLAMMLGPGCTTAEDPIDLEEEDLLGGKADQPTPACAEDTKENIEGPYYRRSEERRVGKECRL